jgi:hypothetical protein
MFQAEKIWIWVDFLLVGAFFMIAAFLFYQRQKIQRFVYECELYYASERVCVSGYYDSGNLATHENLPVCLISPEIAYALSMNIEMLYAAETPSKIITTASGEKQTRLFRGELLIKGKKEKKSVYFAVLGNMVGREHKLILHANILGKDG